MTQTNGLPTGSFGSPGTPVWMNFLRRLRQTARGLIEVAPIGKPPAGDNTLNSDRYHLASRTGKRTNPADPYTMRPLATYQGGSPTTAPSSILGGVVASNVRPNPADGALGNGNPIQEFGANTVYDGKLPAMPLARAMPYAKIPPKLPGHSTQPSTLAATGFVDPYRIQGKKAGGGPVSRGLKWKP